MGSKTNTSISTSEQLDNSQVQGVNAIRGDANTLQLLDGDAIKQAFAFGNQNSEGQAKSIGDTLKTFGTLADKTLKNAFESGQEALGFASKASDKSYGFSTDVFKSFVDGTKDAQRRLAESGNTANSAVMSAYSRAQNNGLDPQTLMLGALALGALFIFKK